MQLTIDIRAEALLARLAGTSERLSQAMHRVVTRLSIGVQAAVKDKLTGQVLHVRTGTLRRSINRVVTQEGDNTTATIGTNVVYAGIHEFGFTGSVVVRAHERKIRAPATATTSKNGVQRFRKGGVVGVANVREYSRQVNMPARSYLRSTLTEWAPRITSELRAAAMEAIRL